MSGPLPDENAVRRNAPTIPTTKLPAGGRSGPAPVCPLPLGDAGRGWWAWAWATPQASAWSDGDTQFIARRASLEDDLAALARVEGLDLDDLLGCESDAAADRAIRRVAALATGRVSLLKEMREMDDRLGLTPKALAALRWKIVEDAPAPAASGPVPAGVADLGSRRARLTG